MQYSREAASVSSFATCTMDHFHDGDETYRMVLVVTCADIGYPSIAFATDASNTTQIHEAKLTRCKPTSVAKDSRPEWMGTAP